MVDVTSSATAAPAPTATPVAAVSPTVGQSVDAEITLVKSRIAALESAAKTDWSAVKSWVKSNWPHFVTWISLAASSAPVVAVVKAVL